MSTNIVLKGDVAYCTFFLWIKENLRSRSDLKSTDPYNWPYTLLSIVVIIFVFTFWFCFYFVGGASRFDVQQGELGIFSSLFQYWPFLITYSNPFSRWLLASGRHGKFDVKLAAFSSSCTSRSKLYRQLCWNFSLQVNRETGAIWDMGYVGHRSFDNFPFVQL